MNYTIRFLSSNRVQLGTLLGLNTLKGLQEANAIKQNKVNDTTTVAIQPTDSPENAIPNVHSGETRFREDISAASHVDANTVASVPVQSYHLDFTKCSNGPNLGEHNQVPQI